LLNIQASGNVGVGTAVPGAKLHINGATLLENGGLNGSMGTDLIFSASGVSSIYQHSISSSHSAASDSQNIMKFSVSNAANTAVDVLTLLGSGNVGIGTTTPTALFSLQGAGTAKDLLSIASTTNGVPVLTITQWGGLVQRISSSSAVSIQMASGTPVFEVDTTSSDVNAGIDITAATGQTSNLLNMYSSGGTYISGFTAAGGLFMNMSSSTAINVYDGSGNAAFIVSSSGKSLGVGTSTLTYALNVDGSQASTYIARINNSATNNTADGLLISLGVANASRSTGNYFIGFANGSETVAGKIQGGADAVAYTTSAADLAEYFRISDLNDKPKFGEIVVLDKSKERSVVVASASVDQKEPLGVVSTNPGFVGNAPICLINDNNCDQNYAQYNVLVSLAGQVPVKISLENGPIAVGDYLTLSSTTPGVAVKMVESGYIIGIAVTEATTTVFHTLESTFASSTSYSNQTVTAFIKNGWRDMGAGSLVTNESGVEIPGVFSSLFKFFKTIGLEVGQNFVKITNLVTEKIMAQKVETKELCIEDICVNKTQLQALILNAGITASGPSISSGSTTSPTLPTATSTTPIASTTPEVIPTATTTPEIIPTPEPTATTTPEIVPPTEPTPPAPEPAPIGTSMPDTAVSPEPIVTADTIPVTP